MGFFSDRILVPLFMVVLKTKRIAKSAMQGKLNYQARKIAPVAVGILIAAWTFFIFLV
jgi:hypothetical protein